MEYKKAERKRFVLVIEDTIWRPRRLIRRRSRARGGKRPFGPNPAVAAKAKGGLDSVIGTQCVVARRDEPSPTLVGVARTVSYYEVIHSEMRP